MSAVSRTWDQLTLPGKFLAVVVPLLLFLTAGGVITIVLFGGLIWQAILDHLEIVRMLAAVLILVLVFVPFAFVIIYMELKVIARMNLRIGPDRVGPWGTLMSLVPGLKVLVKEDFIPTRADPIVFTWAPVVVFATSVMSALVLPFAPGIYGRDLNIGLLYFFAVGGMTVVGLLMGGWASFNKYSLLGGLRSAAQIVSYEIPLTLSVVGLIILAGTMSLNTIVEQQSGWFTSWYVFRQPLAFVIFFIAATAEANRTPFDLTEADSEIVAGFATEYSGMRFGFFFFAEYVNVFIVSALTTVLFLGGWNAPIDLPHVAIALDPGAYGLALLFFVLLAPVVGTLILAAPVYLMRSRTRWWVALIVGFVLFNLIAGALIFLWAYVSFDFVAGLVWFLAKAFGLVFVFVWMRGTLPRVRIDQLMGFAWKWLLPASLLNLFVTAIAVVAVTALKGNPI
ncbi:MAG TPA: complex I subunit 1 family protein [Candidatus Limnocylindrales bacterium]|nr:complex I subunit 1 family protein [Candidatus Limnocylindrales bacterium]